jgi:formate transporter
MAFFKPNEIAQITVEVGKKKANLPIGETLAIGFQAGAFIALGYLLYIRLVAGLPAEWGSFSSFLGASVFPIGLILTLVAGGELLTGNMMAVPLARLAKRITTRQLMMNWLWVTFSNLVGALFVAFLFGHLVGLTEAEPYLSKTIDIARHKIDATFLQAFLSGIGCNWLVALAVWLSYGAKSEGSKLFVIWFPTMAFVAIGFQHVVANMFVIPAAIFAGGASWNEFIGNFIPVFLGNAAGGGIIVAWGYWSAYLKREQKSGIRLEHEELTAPASR